jgi:hypothetical protein
MVQKWQADKVIKSAYSQILSSNRLERCGLYYKHVMIVNDDSSIVSNWSFKLIDNARVIIYDRNMFVIQATGLQKFFQPSLIFGSKVIAYLSGGLHLLGSTWCYWRDNTLAYFFQGRRMINSVWKELCKIKNRV